MGTLQTEHSGSIFPARNVDESSKAPILVIIQTNAISKYMSVRGLKGFWLSRLACTILVIIGWCIAGFSQSDTISTGDSTTLSRNGGIKFKVTPEQLLWMKSNPTITFTGEPDWLPFEAFDQDGKYVGIVAEYLDELETILPFRIQRIPVANWTKTLELSMEGSIDIISGDNDDIVLRENYNPIKPYMTTSIVIVMRDDHSFINDLGDISDQRIVLIDGYANASKVEKQYPEISFTKIGDPIKALEELSVGRYDAVIMSLPKAGYTIRTKGFNNLKIVGKTSVKMEITLFVHKNKPMLHELVGLALASIPDAAHQEILKEWMEVEFAEKVDYQLILQLAGAFLFIALLILYWNRKITIARREAEKQKERFEELAVKLSKYLSSQIYDILFRGKAESSLSPRRKKLTIFFSDIAGFTNLTEQLEPEELTNLLNNYLTEMTNIALKYGATVDKYIGDAMVIFFGDPVSLGYRTDALSCVEMAIEMLEKLKEIQADIIDQGIADDFKIRIGINTGYCTVGNFGSSNRMDYTIIGNAVNLASRLESNATPDTILLAHETWSLVKEDIDCVKQDVLKLKGISKDMQTYQVIGFKAPKENDTKISIAIPGLKIELDEEKVADKAEVIAALGKMKDKLG